jgi:UDP-N-acetyl-2-amino-2-deoxyglucuronate dehydrogenase
VFFFTEIERFDRFLEKQRRLGSSDRVDYVSVCSPNYLHDAHCRLGLRVHADVICEKPLVISPWNIDALMELEEEYGKRIYSVLQLRLLPAMIDLKREIEKTPPGQKLDLVLSYITRRGHWYHVSWKGDEAKSGGLSMNIGVHFFDLLLWIFGKCEKVEVHLKRSDKMAGWMALEKANVTWFLSIDKSDLPEDIIKNGKAAYRSLTMNGEEVEFSYNFTELHTEVYREILAGRGYGLQDVRSAIDLVYQIRRSDVVTNPAVVHPKLRT